MPVLPSPPFDASLSVRARQAFEDHDVREQRGNWAFCECGSAMVVKDRSAHLRDVIRQAGVALVTDKQVYRLTAGIEALLTELVQEMTPEEFQQDGPRMLATRHIVHGARHLFGVPCAESSLIGPDDGTDLVALTKDVLDEHEALSLTLPEGSDLPDVSCACGEVVPGAAHGEHAVVSLFRRGVLLVDHEVTTNVLGRLCLSVRVWDLLCGSGKSVPGIPLFPDDYSQRLHELAEYTEFIRDELAIPPSE